MIESPVLLPEESSALKKRLDSIGFEYADLLPGYGVYNYMKRVSGARNFGEYVTFLREDIKGITFSDFAHMGINPERFPANEELRAPLTAAVLRNCAVWSYHIVTVPAACYGLYYFVRSLV